MLDITPSKKASARAPPSATYDERSRVTEVTPGGKRQAIVVR